MTDHYIEGAIDKNCPKSNAKPNYQVRINQILETIGGIVFLSHLVETISLSIIQTDMLVCLVCLVQWF
jgi:hypothetical protein